MTEAEKTEHLAMGLLVAAGLAVGGYYIYKTYLIHKENDPVTGKKFVEVAVVGPPPRIAKIKKKK